MGEVMERKDSIGIGIVGAGFLAETRARCYTKGGKYQSRILGVAETVSEKAKSYAAKYSIPRVYSTIDELLAQPDIDMVDLCVPNHLHRPMTEAAAAAGKHIVCTKPLTAYVGQDLPADTPDEMISSKSREEMLAIASEDSRKMVEAANSAGVKLMYGENWIFSPSISKVAELIRTSQGTIVEMRGGECHSGSHSPFSKIWRYTGGGALIRLGAHPIGSMLYLKKLQGITNSGRPVLPVSVTAEVANLGSIPALVEERTFFARGWKDVENWASVLICFDDGSRGIVWASDAVLGGMESRLEVYMSNAVFKCNLSPNNLVYAFTPDSGVFGQEYLMEKLETKSGWSTPMPDEDWTSGHLAMCQSFVQTVAENTQPISDGQLGSDVVRVVYSAYCSAQTGERVMLD
jgi:predicted dehydrogenase